MNKDLQINGKSFTEKRKRRKRKKKLKEKKNGIYFKTRHERKMLKRNIRNINQTEREVAEKENEIIENRRKSRERFIESLKIGDIKIIESAKQSMLSYEIGLKLQQQENERDF